jgi:hypothetical protein
MDAPAGGRDQIEQGAKGVLILMVFSVFINYIDRSIFRWPRRM